MRAFFLLVCDWKIALWGCLEYYLCLLLLCRLLNSAKWTRLDIAFWQLSHWLVFSLSPLMALFLVWFLLLGTLLKANNSLRWCYDCSLDTRMWIILTSSSPMVLKIPILRLLRTRYITACSSYTSTLVVWKSSISSSMKTIV